MSRLSRGRSPSIVVGARRLCGPMPPWLRGARLRLRRGLHAGGVRANGGGHTALSGIGQPGVRPQIGSYTLPRRGPTSTWQRSRQRPPFPPLLLVPVVRLLRVAREHHGLLQCVVEGGFLVSLARRPPGVFPAPSGRGALHLRGQALLRVVAPSHRHAHHSLGLRAHGPLPS